MPQTILINISLLPFCDVLRLSGIPELPVRPDNRNNLNPVKCNQVLNHLCQCSLFSQIFLLQHLTLQRLKHNGALIHHCRFRIINLIIQEFYEKYKTIHFTSRLNFSFKKVFRECR